MQKRADAVRNVEFGLENQALVRIVNTLTRSSYMNASAQISVLQIFPDQKPRPVESNCFLCSLVKISRRHSR